MLDLGDCASSAELLVNGQSAGIRVLRSRFRHLAVCAVWGQPAGGVGAQRAGWPLRYDPPLAIVVHLPPAYSVPVTMAVSPLRGERSRRLHKTDIANRLLCRTQSFAMLTVLGRRNQHRCYLKTILMLCCGLVCSGATEVSRIRVQGPIGPSTVSYSGRALLRFHPGRAGVLGVGTGYPGGLLDSTKEIVNSSTPRDSRGGLRGPFRRERHQRRLFHHVSRAHRRHGPQYEHREGRTRFRSVRRSAAAGRGDEGEVGELRK